MPGATIYLFGSAAKGLRTADSGLDVLIISPARLSRQAEAEVAEAISRLELANGVVISILFYAREEWEAPLAGATPVSRQRRFAADARVR